MADINQLTSKVRNYDPNADLALIKRAYDFSKDAHKEQKRLSGEEFFVHPFSVAEILTEFKADVNMLAAALLHDVVEDCGVKLDDIKEKFNADVASLVDGVTKITSLKLKSKEAYKAESLRKILLAATQDVRVIIIKLADKLHNMRTLQYMREEKQKEISKEVMEIYAPIAYRLGMDKIKAELEDLAFKFLEPDKFREMEEKMIKSREEREKEVDKMKHIITEVLQRHNISSTAIKGRPKHIYSIYKKMQKKSLSFEEVFDKIALRIIVNTVRECYEALGILHGIWKPIAGTFDDYIANPKSNLYQSLHTALIGPDKAIVEIQIRTKEMDEFAEEGIAAHWRYKGLESSGKFEKKLAWTRQILEWQKEAKSAQEFVEHLQKEMFADEIYCYTPKGDVIELPVGATVLDFAYAVHSDVGDHASGAKIDGEFTSLRQELKMGNVVEIITAKNQRPHRDWLKIAKTSKAVGRIKRTLSLFDKIPVKALVQKIPFFKQSEQSIIDVKGLKNPAIKLAQCCNPLPGEDIVGFSTKTGLVSVHKKDCDKIGSKESIAKKKMDVAWKQEIGNVVELKVEAVDRVGLFADLLNNISYTGINVQEAKVKLLGKDKAECRFKVRPDDLLQLRNLINRIKKVKNVIKISIGQLKV